MILASAVSFATGKEAAALTADYVLNEMPAELKATYVAGLVDGFAFARWIADRPDDTGMKCIQDWYYGSGNQKWAQIEQWFARHPDKPADALLYVLIKKECGE